MLFQRDLNIETILDAMGRNSITPRIANSIDLAKQSRILLLRHNPSRVGIDVRSAHSHLKKKWWLEPFKRSSTGSSSRLPGRKICSS